MGIKMENEREFGRFEGMVIQKLDNLEQKLDTFQEDINLFKQDIYSRVMQNSQDIAHQKGWMAGLGILGGIIGDFIRSLIFRR